MQENITNPKDSSSIRLNSTRFGELNIESEFIWHFPKGLAGLKNCNHFALINADQSSGTIFMWLHSIDRPDLAIPVMNPLAVFSDYTIRQDEPGIMGLELNEADGDIQVLVMVTVPHGDPQGITANLAAPLILQTGTKNGWQVILEKGPYKVAQPLFADRNVQSGDNDVLVSVGNTSPLVKISNEPAGATEPAGSTESAVPTGESTVDSSDEVADKSSTIVENNNEFENKAKVRQTEVVSPPESV